MKNLVYVFVALIVAFSSCRNTEVGVDEVKAPVKFEVTQLNNVELTLKGSVGTPSTLQSYAWIDGMNIAVIPSVGAPFNEDFTFDGVDDLIVNCPIGLNSFAFLTTCNLPEVFDGDVLSVDAQVKVDELRTIQPYMIYDGNESANITYSNTVQTVPVNLDPALGRMIITVDACQSLKDAFDVSASVTRCDSWDFVQNDVPMYAQYSGPAAVDDMQFQVAVTIFEKGTDTAVRTIHTSIWGQIQGNQTAQEAQAQSEKMQMDAGFDKWVEIKISNADPYAVNFAFEVFDLQDKKELIVLP